MALFVLIGIVLILLGPVGLFVALSCFNKVSLLHDELERLREEIRRLRRRLDEQGLSAEGVKTPASTSTEIPRTEVVISPLVPDVVPPETPPAEPVSTETAWAKETAREEAAADGSVVGTIDFKPPEQEQKAVIEATGAMRRAEMYCQLHADRPVTTAAPAAKAVPVQSVGLEQRIGTQWVLVAGIVCVIAAVGFFLKYAYENAWFGPWAKVCIVAGGGLLSFIIGEVTRRRGYEVVAKGVSAMGFALLYASVFSAYKFYNLIDTTWAYGGAIAVTIAAMTYAVVLDEILVAILSLLGGYATPLWLTTGKNLPHHLFGYVLILSLGAMVCAFFRRWRAVNVLAFIGTFLLYTLWFEKFCRPMLDYSQAHQDKLLVAELWLGVFFVVYLVTPLLYGWTKKVAAMQEDLALPCMAGMITYYYLWTMLDAFFRTELSFCTAAIGLMYMAAAGVSWTRCRDDKSLRMALGVAGIAFITAALPLYFKTNALVIGWTIEAVMLIWVGVTYQGYWIQVMGLIVTALSLAGLYWVPLHSGRFLPILNGLFCTWMTAATGALVSHFTYRRARRPVSDEGRTISEILFIAATVTACWASILEWRGFCRIAYQTIGGQADEIFIKGLLCIIALTAVVITAVGLGYRSILIRTTGIAAAAASMLGLVMIFGNTGDYRLIYNRLFGTWLVVGLCAAAQHWLYRYWKEPQKSYPGWSQLFYGAAVFVLLGTGVLEWHRYWSHQEITDALITARTLQGLLAGMSAFAALMAARPFSPAGGICRAASVLMAAVAAIAGVANVEMLYSGQFRFVLNGSFLCQMAVVAAIFIAAVHYRRQTACEGIDSKWYQAFGLAGVVELWVILSEQIFIYWYCQNEYGPGVVNWQFRAHLCLSLLWAGYAALMLIVGFWKHLPIVRYMALGLFGLLLAKVFLFDLSTVKSIFRVTAFLATGLTMVGVSYVYQYLKKQGFFEKLG